MINVLIIGYGYWGPKLARNFSNSNNFNLHSICDLNSNSLTKAKKMGISDLNKKYDLSEIVRGDSIFCATGITTGDLVNGVELKNNIYHTETLVTHKNSTIDIIKKKVSITWLIYIYTIKEFALVPSSIG